MKRLAGLILLLFCMVPDVSACTCARMTDFNHSAADALVIRGVVREYVFAYGLARPIAMKVDVLETMKGDYRAKEITVIGDFGMSCIPYVSNFPVGTEWVMAVHGPSEVDGLGDENYAPPACAVAFLRVEKGRVTIATRESRVAMPLVELRKMLAD